MNYPIQVYNDKTDMSACTAKNRLYQFHQSLDLMGLHIHTSQSFKVFKNVLE